MEIILLFGLACLGAILYRKGGAANSNTKYRDVGVALVVILTMAILGIKNWSLLLSGLLLFGALTTYLDFLNKYMKRDKDEFWFNWLLIGITYNLAMLPTVIYNRLWIGFFLRLLILPALFVASDFLIDIAYLKVKAFSGKDKAIPKEQARGFLTVITLPLLLIGFTPENQKA